MLDEKALRRPTLDESASAPLELPGGTTWLLPKPYYRIRPVFAGGKRTNESVLCTDDPEFDRLKKEVEKAGPDPEADFVGAVIDLAAYMLSVNYDLDDDRLAEAFAIPLDRPHNERWMTDLMAIAHGSRAPKPSAVG